MFTDGGQIDRLHRAVHGGGKGGGGGGYTPPPPVVMTDPVTGKSYTGDTASADLNAEIDQRKQQEKADSDAAVAKKAADDAAALGKFNTAKGNAYNDALSSITRQFQQQGVDPSQYMASDITPRLTAAQNTIRDLDPNPAAAYAPDLGSSIINDITSGKRTTANNQLNNLFSPTYSQSAVPDSLTGQYQDTLLNEQFNPLSDQLLNAQKRGTLTDAGYQAALASLGQKRSTAASTIGNLGSGIISTDRSGIDNYISGARKDASGLSLSSSFDPNVYASGAKGLADTDISNFGGALRNAIGGTQFADLGSLINAGGAVQGATNPNAANPKAGVGGVTPPAEDEANTKRGLGSTGAF